MVSERSPIPSSVPVMARRFLRWLTLALIGLVSAATVILLVSVAEDLLRGR